MSSYCFSVVVVFHSLSKLDGMRLKQTKTRKASESSTGHERLWPNNLIPILAFEIYSVQ